MSETRVLPVLLCSLETITPSDNGSTVELGINLVPALLGKEDRDKVAAILHERLSARGPAFGVPMEAARKLLQPWEWSWARPLRFHPALKTATQAVALTPVEEIRDEIPEALGLRMGRLVRDLCEDFGERSKHPARLEWQQISGNGEARRPPWPTVVADLSQLPWPFPQELGLVQRAALDAGEIESHLAAEETPDGGAASAAPDQDAPASRCGELVVAPELPAGLLVPEALTPDPAVVFDDGVRLVTYRHGGEVVAVSLCRPLPVKAGEVGSPDEGSWIGLKIFAEDWRRHFDRRVTESVRWVPSLLDDVLTWEEPPDLADLHDWVAQLVASFGERPPSVDGSPDYVAAVHRLRRYAEELYTNASTEEDGTWKAGEQLRCDLLEALDGADGVTKEKLADGCARHLRSLWEDPPRELERWIRTTSQRVAGRLLPRDGTDGDRPASAATEGITFEVYPLARDPGSGDPLEDSRGVIAFARRRPAGSAEWEPWYCLNWALPLHGDPPPLTEEPLLLAARLGYQGDLRQSTLTYDNAPLAVEGPLESLRAWELCGGEACGASGLDSERLVRFVFSPDAPLPGLAFGYEYQVAAFKMGNSGSVPADLRRPGPAASPWRLAALDPCKVDEQLGAALERRAEKGFPYQRRVPLGSLRVRSCQSALGAPPGVLPRLEKDEDKKRSLPDPILFLHENLGSGRSRSWASFEIRPPAVDWITWDRWIAADAESDPEQRELRSEVLRAYLTIRDRIDCMGFHSEVAPDGGPDLDDPGLPEPRLVLDDPAVRGFQVRIEDLESHRLLVDRRVELNPQPAAIDRDRLPPAVRVRPFTLELAVSGTTDPGDCGNQHKARFELPAGGLYRVNVHSVLDPRAEDRFAVLDSETSSTGDLVSLSAWTMDVEVAEGFLESSDQRERAWALLWERLVTRVEGGELQVKLDLAPSGSEVDDAVIRQLQRHISRVDLLRQSWAWRGRPVPIHPDLAQAWDEPCDPAAVATPEPPSPPAASAGDAGANEERNRYGDWEMLAMGHRGDSDHGLYPMNRQGESRTTWVFEEDLGTGPDAPDPRASHHRFAVRVHSRYSALYGPDEGWLEALDPERRVRWRRAFVPCRWERDVPAPKVKAVLPLADDRAGDGTRFLVVLGEPWHRVGGLAERLAVEVMSWAGPSVDSDLGRDECLKEVEDYLERVSSDGPSRKHPDRPIQGPDPILSTKPSDLDAPVVLDPGAAIGHSREINTALPLITASSFLVRLLDPVSGGPFDRSWWFLQIRFRREVCVEKRWVCSEPTQPYTVQTLPAFTLKRADVAIEARWDDGDIVLTPPPEPSGAKLRTYLLLTREVIDALGRRGEIFLGIMFPKPSSSNSGRYWAEKGVQYMLEDLTVDETLRIRLLEVQRPHEGEPFRSSDDLWNALFPKDRREFPEGRREFPEGRREFPKDRREFPKDRREVDARIVRYSAALAVAQTAAMVERTQ